MMRNAMLVIGLATLVAFAAGATGQEDSDAAAESAAAGVSIDGFPFGEKYNYDDFVALTGRTLQFSESPMLQAMVAAGDLPPVEQRLPDNPLVLVPWEEVGQYGGTLQYSHWSVGGDTNLRHINGERWAERLPAPGTNMTLPFNGELRPGVFESWEYSDGGRTLTLNIRPGIKWSDGVPITSEDIRYSFEDNFLNTDVYANPSRAANWGGAPIQVDVVDDTTVRLRWAKPYAGWINGDWRPGAWQHPIRPSHFLKQFHQDYRSMDELLPIMQEAGFEGAGDWGRFYLSVDPGRWRGQFISGGLKGTFDLPVFSPWMPVAEPSAGEYVLERNPYYYMVDVAGNQLPYIDTVHRTFVSNREVVDLAIIQGDTDFQVYEPTLESFTLYKENENAGGYRTMLLAPRQDMTGVIVFNLTTSDEAVRELVQDVRFRRALSLAINRDEINETVFLGLGRTAQISPIPTSDYYEEGMDTAWADYDPDGANALLDEMGLTWDGKGEVRLRNDGQPVSLRIEHPELLASNTPIAELTKAYWEAVGVKTDIKVMDGANFWPKFFANDIQVTVWQQHGSDPTDYWVTRLTPSRLWATWYDTGGAEGETPPDWVQELFRLSEIPEGTPDRQEAIDATKEIYRMLADGLWEIGAVQAPVPFIYSQRLGNIAPAQERNLYRETIAENAELWFFRN